MSDDPKNSFTPRFDDDSVPRFDDDTIPGFGHEATPERAHAPEPKGGSAPIPRFDDDSIPPMDFSDEVKPAVQEVLNVEDYVSSLRESLTSDEAERTSSRKSGGLFGRLTGTLRRVTGPMGGTGALRRAKTGDLPPAPATPAEHLPEEELEDTFLADRLGGTGRVASPPPLPEARFEEPEPSLPEAFGLRGDEPIELLDSGAIAALGQAEEQARIEEREQDWMREVRQDTDAPSAPATPDREAVPPRPRGVTGQLRSFITGVLRRKQTGPLAVPDDVVSGRLERSLNTGMLQAPPEERTARTPAQPGQQAPEKPVSGRLPRSMTTGQLTGPSKDAAHPNAPQDEDISVPEWEAPRLEQPGLLDLRSELEEDTADATGTGQSALDQLADLSAQQTEDDLLSERLASRFFVEEDEADLLPGVQAPATEDFSAPDIITFEDISEDISNEGEGEDFLEDRFGLLGDRPPSTYGPSGYSPPTRRPIETAALGDFEITPEEEQPIWESPAQPPADEVPPVDLSGEDIWSSLNSQPLTFAEDEQQDWPAPIEIETGPTLRPGMGGMDTDLLPHISDEDYASTYLTGGDVAAPDAQAGQTDRMLREALERTESDEQFLDAMSLREIALEGYQGAGLPHPQPGAEALAGSGEDEDEESIEVDRPFSLRTWLSKRSAMEKFLLFEGVIVILAVLIAVPYFVFVIVRGPVKETAPVQWLVPHPLAANLPYPTGLTLPGGWNFPLQKSTFIEGQWKPAHPEWLEGTELRRVVALPWNPQTEAVIETFKVGDRISLNLSNNATAKYKVDSVERVPSSDNSIFAGRKPSLVIVLYQETAAERWVVICSQAK